MRRTLSSRFPAALPVLGLLVIGAAVVRADGVTGDVYVMTNQASGNSVVVFHRDAAGVLTAAGSFATGGNGAGTGADPLGSQDSLVLTDDQRLLLAVNAGSNSVSVFAVSGDALTLLGAVPSGGVMPVSVAVKHDLVYVLNAGGTPNISGFTLDPQTNRLIPLPGSTRDLPGGAAAGPAEVAFDQDGSVLVVTEKNTNQIDTFTVENRLAGPGVSFPSSGLTPFGFVFGHDNVAFVSDAAATTAGSSSVASYNVADDGNVAVITPALTFPEAAACWLVVPQNNRFAYTANAASGTIASFAIGEGGNLSLLQAVAASTGNGSTPTDMAVSGNSRFLYVRDGGTGSVNGFQIEADGGLTPITTATGLPNGAQGIAAR